MRLRQSLVAALLTMAAAFPTWAATYYVAPAGAKIGGTPDGSKSKPWASPLTAIAKAKAGDTILLMDGSYAGLIIKDRSFGSPVTIRSMNGKKALLERIAIDGKSQNLTFQNLSVWPAKAGSKANRLQVASTSANIVFDGIDVRGSQDASNYPNWTKDQWLDRDMKGVHIKGTSVTVKNSSFTGLGFATVLEGPNTKFLNNTVQGFSGDGLRVQGNNSVVSGNRITDCVRYNGNHPDAIQSWSQNGKPVTGLVIENNTIIEWSNPKVSKYRCSLQGISLFDGFYDDIVVRNNVVSTTAYHGIALYGVRGAKVVNNTVVNIKGSAVGHPWIRVNSHKNGSPSRDVTQANNIAMAFSVQSNTVNKKLSDNSVIKYPAKVLQDITKFNYRPKADSGFIDTGDATYAPKTDIANNKRPSGKAPDRGAYEANSSPASAADLSASTAGAAPPSSVTAGKWLVAP